MRRPSPPGLLLLCAIGTAPLTGSFIPHIGDECLTPSCIRKGHPYRLSLEAFRASLAIFALAGLRTRINLLLFSILFFVSAHSELIAQTVDQTISGDSSIIQSSPLLIVTSDQRHLMPNAADSSRSVSIDRYTEFLWWYDAGPSLPRQVHRALCISLDKGSRLFRCPPNSSQVFLKVGRSGQVKPLYLDVSILNPPKHGRESPTTLRLIESLLFEYYQQPKYSH